MIAMQYRFPLPADYDMGIIDRRIADKGHLTDGFPGLLFKAYLSARKSGPAQDNAYAPFYVWNTVEGMHAFLNGPGFAGVSQAFGRPSVATWLVWQAQLGPGFARARFASVERIPIAPGTDLEALRSGETRLAVDAVDGGGALAAVAGYEPGGWTLVRFRLWDREPGANAAVCVYAVGHVSAAPA
ncbi:DUF4865 family protein [Telluria mixta]|uniref:DUF4865 family protein n=1 Tax=Telluria mixta TaxID=34071 RepID=A0ABT2C7Z9_9BURK|nr:DUF4865 family protein [Telluria mixta]MCS0633532.1 DUF4865 family protein [Telluria mixta]WEM96001.1 DUF4865 family protein [Telluria mixta]